MNGKSYNVEALFPGFKRSGRSQGVSKRVHKRLVDFHGDEVPATHHHTTGTY